MGGMKEEGRREEEEEMDGCSHFLSLSLSCPVSFSPAMCCVSSWVRTCEKLQPFSRLGADLKTVNSSLNGPACRAEQDQHRDFCQKLYYVPLSVAAGVKECTICDLENV